MIQSNKIISVYSVGLTYVYVIDLNIIMKKNKKSTTKNNWHLV